MYTIEGHIFKCDMRTSIDIMVFIMKRLLPDNALKRAQIRFFVEYFSSKVSPHQYKILGNLENKEARQTAYNDINTALVRVSVRGDVDGGQKDIEW